MPLCTSYLYKELSPLHIALPPNTLMVMSIKVFFILLPFYSNDVDNEVYNTEYLN